MPAAVVVVVAAAVVDVLTPKQTRKRASAQIGRMCACQAQCQLHRRHASGSKLRRMVEAIALSELVAMEVTALAQGPDATQARNTVRHQCVRHNLLQCLRRLTSVPKHLARRRETTSMLLAPVYPSGSNQTCSGRASRWSGCGAETLPIAV